MAHEDEIEGLIHQFSDPEVEPAWRLDALLDLQHREDPRITLAVLRVVSDAAQPVSVRLGGIRALRGRLRTTPHRVEIAQVLTRIVSDATASDSELRLEATVALGDCIDIPGVMAELCAVCAEPGELFDVRYAAFLSLQRGGPTPEAIDALTRLSSDETWGLSAQGILIRWQSP